MKKKLPRSGKSYSPSHDTGEWKGSDGFPHALSRISFLLKDCVNTAEGIVRDKYHELNPAMLEWQKTFRSDAARRINPLFCYGYPLTYPVPNSSVKHLDCIPYCAFHACLEAAFNGNYNLGLSVLDIEKDLARCFMYTQKKLVEVHAANYNSYTDVSGSVNETLRCSSSGSWESRLELKRKKSVRLKLNILPKNAENA